jgi:hypothetical protein
MKRIITVLAAMAIMAAMLAASAGPAFADKGAPKGTGAGHSTNDESGDCETGCTGVYTASGKDGNTEGGPGHTKTTTFRDYSAYPFSPNTHLSQDTTSSGHTERGGGKMDYTFHAPGDFLFSNSKGITDEKTCVGSDDGSGAPDDGSNTPCS